jgi:hypothetical protein
MAARLGWNRYGKSEVRLVRVTREGDRHDLTDLTVSVGLEGDFAEAHEAGDNALVLPTDTMKNTVYAFAKEHDPRRIEEFALILARHFLDASPPAARALVEIDRHGWNRIEMDGSPHPHAFTRGSAETESPRVERISFPGAEALDERLLRGAIVTEQTSCRGFLLQPFCWLTDWHVLVRRYHLDREELERDELRLRVLHFRHGYREARVAAELLPRGRGVEVVFHVDEGPPTVLEELRVVQTEEVLGERAVQRAGLPRRGNRSTWSRWTRRSRTWRCVWVTAVTWTRRFATASCSRLTGCGRGGW